MNIVFTPGVDFENLLSKAEFETVASRSAQSATLKAEKTGKGSVDLEAAKNKANSSKNEGDGGNTPSGDNTPSGGTPSEGNTPSGSEGSENSGNTDNGTGEDNEL